MKHKLSGLLFISFFPFSNPVLAQTSTLHPHPDTSAGFRQQLEELVTLHQSGDKAAFRSALDAFAIPNANDWIAAHFSLADVAKLQRDYRVGLADFERQTIYAVETIESLPDKTVVAKPCDHPRPPEESGPEAAVPAPLQPISIECIRYSPLHPASSSLNSWRDSFIYMQGIFRYAGRTYPFWLEELENLRNAHAAIEPARLITRVQPQYPEKARKKRIEGDVRIRIKIGKDGVPSDLAVLSGDPLLVDAALKAVRQWRYEPVKRNGVPAEMETTIDVYFQLNRN
jgi:TonB family protein